MPLVPGHQLGDVIGLGLGNHPIRHQRRQHIRRTVKPILKPITLRLEPSLDSRNLILRDQTLGSQLRRQPAQPFRSPIPIMFPIPIRALPAVSVPVAVVHRLGRPFGDGRGRR